MSITISRSPEGVANIYQDGKLIQSFARWASASLAPAGGTVQLKVDGNMVPIKASEVTQINGNAPSSNVAEALALQLSTEVFFDAQQVS